MTIPSGLAAAKSLGDLSSNQGRVNLDTAMNSFQEQHNNFDKQEKHADDSPVDDSVNLRFLHVPILPFAALLDRLCHGTVNNTCFDMMTKF